MSDQTTAQRSGCPDDAEHNTQLSSLVDMVMHRLALAQDYAAAKYRSGDSIDDPVSEKYLLDSGVDALNATRLDVQIVMQFIADQIEASKVIERSLHHRWRRHPEEIPAKDPERAADVASRLEQITMGIVQRLKHMDEVPRFRPEDIADAIETQYSVILSERQLPRLHRHAAVFAMRSLWAAEG
jgi:chorismate mutase